MPPTRAEHALEWVASVIQIGGYAARAFALAPWNHYLFLGGVLRRSAVGVLWHDRAIMLIHAVALGAMVAGMTAH
ncbi:MAG: DUF6552 family protein [Pseudomonadota bacterium]